MGLDMNLNAVRHIGGYDHSPGERMRFVDILGSFGLTIADACEDSPWINVSVAIGHWRNANAIHGWFVRHVQGGEDECYETDVSREDLKLLRATCLSVLDNHDLSLELLPPVGGFFFGGTDLDDYYYESLRRTVAIVDKALGGRFEGFDFTYRSNW